MRRSLVIVFSSILIFSSCGNKQTTMDGAVNFTATDLDGNKMEFAQYRGKTVLMNIWATWCGPCLKEIPDLKEIHEQYKDKDVVVLGVLLDSESPEKAKPIVQDELKIPYPTWYAYDEFAKQFGVQAFPTTVIIDKNGKVVSQHVGLQNKEKFLNLLKAAGI